MTRITNYSNFIKNDKPQNNQPKPYIYVLNYILSKEGYFDELRDYILNYSDEQVDYGDDNTYDRFMKTLKIYAMKDKFDEIEDLVFNYEEFDFDDFDESDDDFEEKMYYRDDFPKRREIHFEEEKSPEKIMSEEEIQFDFDELNCDFDDSDRIEELEDMEGDIYDDDNNITEDDVEYAQGDLEDIEGLDSKINGIDIEFEELKDSKDDESFDEIEEIKDEIVEDEPNIEKTEE
jgi:hypothetical protein